MTATTLRHAARDLRSGASSARDLIEQCLARIDQLQPGTNAFIHVDAAGARYAADRADAEMRAGHDRGLLHGVPISLKDLIDQEGQVTTAGSRSMTQVAPADAPCVAVLREHGAVIVGRCNLHEFAMGTTSGDSGFGPVLHPRSSERLAGGSSGGSAVSVATGMSLASIGTDTGGSIRIPAAACGIVGLKPAWGEVPLDGVVPLSPTLDCVGPLARDVEDAWWMLQALRAGPLEQCPVPRASATVSIGVLRAFGWRAVQSPIGERVDAALADLTAAGVRLADVPLATAPSIIPAYGTLVIAEALRFHQPRLAAHGESYTPAVRARLESAVMPPADEYVEALRVRGAIERDVQTLLERVDVLALPTLAIAPPRPQDTLVSWPDGDEAVRAAMLRLTQPFNLSRHPAISIPIGDTSDGWPAGLQLVGRDTRSLVAVALAVERSLM